MSTKGMTYLTNSLFDYRSPENNGVRADFILDAAAHKVLNIFFLILENGNLMLIH